MNRFKKSEDGRFHTLYKSLQGMPRRFVEGFRLHFRGIAAGWGSHWKDYLIQSITASAVVLVIFFAVTPDRPVIVASIGASTFIVFALPKNHTAQPKRVIGGHILGLLSGSLLSFFPQMTILPSTQ
jgi:CBS-domain-containing membrane protein